MSMTGRAIVLALVAACGGSQPPPGGPSVVVPDAGIDAPPPDAAAPDAGYALVIEGAEDNRPGVVIRAEEPVVAGAPATLQVELTAPETTTLRGEYRGFTPEFPMRFDVEPVEGVTIETPGKMTQHSPAPVVWTARRVSFPVTITATAPGPLPLVATLRVSLCTDEMCSADRFTLRWTIDVGVP